MPAGIVNLDALIPRQDFEAGEDVPAVGEIDKIFLRDLEPKQIIGLSLRKPWFQRETAMWTPDKVAAMVSSFLTKDLIPAVILWRSPTGLLFVIDGAHRLSCLLAWVHDDYGIGEKSNRFFSGDYSTRRAKNALEAKKQVELVAAGNYKMIMERHNASDATQDELIRARHVANCSLQIQWVPPGDSKKAESSFFKINEQGVPLDDTERASLYSRDCPNSIAARGVNQFGTGTVHWRRFKGETQKTIQDLSKEVHAAMFSPIWEGNTIQTPMLPIAGRSFIKESLSLVIDTVNITNSVPEINLKKVKSKEAMEQIIAPDDTGHETINYLKRTKNIIGKIIGLKGENESLDLHPLVYFYSVNGKHMPTSFLAWVELINVLDQTKTFMKFTAARKTFEEFLIKHKAVLGQVSRRVRGQIGAVHEVREFLKSAIDLFFEKKKEDEIVKYFHETKGYDFTEPIVILTAQKKKASPEVKSRMYISTIGLPNSSRCKICDARLLDTSISFDHKLDQKFDGLSHSQNLQETHHYCNSAKDKLVPFLKEWAEK